jgi:hypothetical protein
LVFRAGGGGADPGHGRRLRETTVEGILKRHRIRRITTAGVLALLRQKPLTVAPGTAEARRSPTLRRARPWL